MGATLILAILGIMRTEYLLEFQSERFYRLRVGVAWLKVARPRAIILCKS